MGVSCFVFGPNHDSHLIWTSFFHVGFFTHSAGFFSGSTAWRLRRMGRILATFLWKLHHGMSARRQHVGVVLGPLGEAGLRTCNFFFSVAICFFFVDRMANQTPRFLDTLATTICNLNNFIWQYADGIWYSSPFIWGNSHYNKIRDISAGDATICRICLSRHVKCGFHISVGDPSQMTGTPFELEPHQAWCSFQEIIPEISPPSTMKNRRSQNFIVDHYFPIFSPWNIATLRGATYIPYPISPFPLQYPSHHLPERQVSYGWLYILSNIPFLLGDIFHIFPKYQTGILHGHSMTSLLNGDIPIVYKLSLHCHIPIF